MKLYKSFLGLALAALALASTSCDTDNKGAMYDASAINVSFETPKPATIITPDNNAKATVRIIRGNKSGAYTAHYAAQASEAGVFTDNANGTIDFADGETVKEIVVSANNMVPGAVYTYTMTLDDATMAVADTVTNSANRQVVVTIQRDYVWEEAGTCVFTDYLFADDEEAGETGTGVKILHAQDTRLYRIVQPLVACYPGDADYFATTSIDFYIKADGSADRFVRGGLYGAGYRIDASGYDSYFYFVNEGNVFEAQFVVNSEYIGNFKFVWDSWPGAN